MPRELSTDERMRIALRVGSQLLRENPGMSVGESFVAGLSRADEMKVVTREELLEVSDAQRREYMAQVMKDPAAHGLFLDEFSALGLASVPEGGIAVITGYDNGLPAAAAPKCRICHHDAHKGRCQDADDLGVPWDRPCDCET
ncbi:hypothetical protein [Mycobacteroides abscessus]|uniref:hypothetical protein n=1 Tax=Mycobacteroides abscessus TaxID=36809 RepID=UPI0009A7A90B|nr:hypothetical protein [Mycobacteroides abscessus]SLH41903.1 Uncharacterised protein [Mycobacteroides abscessus subsp. massiliense]